MYLGNFQAPPTHPFFGKGQGLMMSFPRIMNKTRTKKHASDELYGNSSLCT